MAGEGSRFRQAGYEKPKPFIDVCGRAMVERVMENIGLQDARYILIARKEHLQREEKTADAIRRKFPCEFVTVDQKTEGSACTILRASRQINHEHPLLLANSDQLVEMDIRKFLADAESRDLDGSILTFHADHPKWSYARTDDRGLVLEVREKEVISHHATVGIYYFRRGRDFVASAEEMIAQNDRSQNEFYTAPSYNYAIQRGLRVGIYEIEESQMFGLGTPEDLQAYLNRNRKNQV